MPVWLIEAFSPKPWTRPRVSGAAAQVEQEPEESQPIELDARGRAFCEGVLRLAEQKIVALKPGFRNQGINDQSISVGHFVGSGCIALGEARARLNEAALALGLPADDRVFGASGTIERALRDGMREPQGVPDAAPAEGAKISNLNRHRKALPGQQDFGSGQVHDFWERFIVPPFPLNVLPPEVHTYVAVRSEAMGCDPAAAAMSALAVMSGALNHGMSLRMKRLDDWKVSPRLWVLLVGRSSTKKSPPLNKFVEPLEAYESKLNAIYLKEMEAYKKEQEKEEPDETIEKPNQPPRYVIGDTTYEKFADILVRNGDKHGLLYKSNEMPGWLASMEQYRSGSGGAARSFWLQAFDGGPYTVDRIVRGTTHIKNLSASIIGGIQPKRAAELKSKMTDDGLLQRFLPVLLRDSVFDGDCEVYSEGYEVLISQLAGLRPARLIMTDAAVERMAEMRLHFHNIERVGYSLADSFDTFMGKLGGICGSLALILHLGHDPWHGHETPVDVGIIDKVKRLVVGFLIPNAIEFYCNSGSSPGEGGRDIASWVLTSRSARFVASDVYKNVASCRGLGLLDINVRVGALVAAGWVQPETPWPTCNAWVVDPRVHVQMAQRADEERQRKAALIGLLKNDLSDW